MTTKGFVVSHAKGAQFERGLRSFYEYRDLGIKAATEGRVDAHVIRAAAGKEFSSQPHLHRTTFQLVYILKGWIEFEYEGQGVVRLEAGSCVHQPPDIRHRELGHSPDLEMLEVVMPAGFATEEVDAVNGSTA
ncbi:MAG TPA: cupin domain-containing protein [Casimicrobiaceae bacterium]|nr:cupin domain-containing protein [Casimicrobiaceae bacterium]